jgi:ABC-type sugar transport system ATPase subunit
MSEDTGGLHVLAEDIRKSFGATEALRGAHLRVPHGGIEGLVGHNGAGKSTLISILAGAVAADSGRFVLDGDVVTDASVSELERRGLALVPQATSIFEGLSVLDNLLIPRWFPVRRTSTIRWSEARRLGLAALSSVGLTADLDQPASSLSVAARRRLMIARALLREPRLLILDEPTEAFAEAEVSQLFETLRELVNGGMTMLYVSHRLDEVLEITDHVTVMREGVTVDRFPAAGLARSHLVRAMLGDEAPVHLDSTSGERRSGVQTPVLRTGQLTTRKLRNVSISVEPGEVVGVYGLAGSGRSELLRVIAGAVPAAAGTVELHGQPLVGPIAARRRRGIAYQPQDTAGQAALGRLSIRENVAIAVPGGVRQRRSVPIVSRRGETELTRAALHRVGLSSVDPEAPLETLSGGMQQRAMMARSIVAGASVWLLDEPMTGLDVRSRAELAAVLRDLVNDRSGGADHGALVVLSDYDDARVMCDRIYTMRAGELTGAFRTDGISEHDLLHAVSFEQPAAA